MLPTDWVARYCVSKEKVKCSLNDKCSECKKEIEQLNNIDNMFKQLKISVDPNAPAS